MPAPPTRDDSVLGSTTAWARWLRTRKWDYWATGTFARPMTEVAASACVEAWWGDVRTHAQAPCYMIAAVETGDRFGRVHAHMLVGGIGAHPQRGADITRLWRWGQIQCVKYDPQRDAFLEAPREQAGACAYIVKHPEALRVYGRLRKFRPRRAR